MSKIVIIKLTSAGVRTGPFNISDNLGNILGENVPKQTLINGISYEVNDVVNAIIVTSIGKCKNTVQFPIGTVDSEQIASSTFTQTKTSCIYRHLKNPEIYNEFYGTIEPYIIEYPFAYQFFDEILQNVKDYTKAYKYFSSPTGVFDDNSKIETDDRWFNKAILYNGQQCSGLLELVPKPKNNLKEYGKYPTYNTDSKTITYTKSDNFYQYNTFWSLVKNKSIPMFTASCKSLSYDKELNQSNMDYGKRSFKKEPLRAKELKVRHILDNRSDAHLTSQFIIAAAQISYK